LRTKLLQNKVLQFLAEDRLEFKKYRSEIAVFLKDREGGSALLEIAHPQGIGHVPGCIK
jgi:hypothetical protein